MRANRSGVPRSGPECCDCNPSHVSSDICAKRVCACKSMMLRVSAVTHDHVLRDPSPCPGTDWKAARPMCALPIPVPAQPLTTGGSQLNARLDTGHKWRD